MIGTSLSGVTFISVPGTVGKFLGGENPYGGFEYYMMVIGFYRLLHCCGHSAPTLLPDESDLDLYLSGKRFNVEAHKIGSVFLLFRERSVRRRAIVSGGEYSSDFLT
jgi:hypothetical protein